MTYCLAIRLDAGIVFCSDSRTHAGVDQVATYSKLHRLMSDGERAITLLATGNLATTQAVVRDIKRDLDAGGKARNLKSVRDMAEVAEYIGHLALEERRKHKTPDSEEFDPEASFIVGGQIAGEPHHIFLIYPQGNYIRAGRKTPYLQIGELKYGTPILNRIIAPDMSLEDAARCALLAMDSAMRGNVSVGPPIELLLYRADSAVCGEHVVLDEDDAYLRELRAAWQASLRQAFEALPRLPERRSGSSLRLVDE